MFSIKNLLRFSRHSWRFNLSELRFEFVTLPKSALQRAVRGWSKFDIAGYGFDSSLGKYIGEALQYLGEGNHGAPNGYGVDNTGRDIYNWETDFDAWSADLKRFGQYFIDMANIDDYMTHKDWSPGSYKKRYEEAEANIQEAYAFLAKYHGSLWD